MSESNTVDIEKARKECEEEALYHQTMMLRARTRRNTFAPISRLHEELLAEIFLHFQRWNTFSLAEPARIQEYTPPIKYPYRWLSITHVCRHWRTVAHSCPRLWTRLIFSRRGLMALAVSCSGRMPLHFNADLLRISMEGMGGVKVVLREIDRIEHLDLTASWHHIVHVHDCLARPAPLLRTLRLFEPMGGMGSAGGRGFTSPLFQAEHPQLQKLALLGVPLVQWTNPLLCPSLTELYLERYETTSYSPTMSEMLTALENMPLLRVIELKSILPNDKSEKKSRALKTVIMPHLQSISLSGGRLSPKQCAYILDHLSLPALRALSLSCLKADGLDTLLSYLATFLHGVEPLRACFMDLQRRFCMEASTSSNLPIDSLSEPGFCLDLRMYASRRKHVLDPAMAFWRTLPLTHIETLLVRADNIFVAEEWRKILAGLHEVTALHILDFPHPSLLEQLSEHDVVKTDPSGEITDLMLPALRNIKFSEVTFASNTDKSAPKLVDILYELLDNRLKHGCGIQKLTLYHCTSLTKQDIETLKNKVHDLVVDDSWPTRISAFAKSKLQWCNGVGI
ncbi:hypothetical protein OBBRIDRAFT_794899 [Obba rivulosa]|uniref:F-box domain-containing protein n=1 Tax=Obba rivulosa TaxID=1052685 RepID=A0A8E2DKF2_9APHY|nr:hypothetical protein OBBRIDRAFT_794899 [Obba rivulosa]